MSSTGHSICSLAAGALLFAASGANAADKGLWQACAVDSLSVCSPAGCRARKPAISIFLSDYIVGGIERAAYYRCAPRLTSCDRYSAVVHRAGQFTVFSLPAQSVFAKLSPDGQVTDVAAVGDTVFVSRGQCVTAAPPSEPRSR